MAAKKLDFGSVLKLDDSNFPKWKMQVTIVLKAYGLWKVVDGTTVRDAADVAKQAEWDKLDTDAQAVLLLSLTSGQMDHVHHCQSAKEVFDKLTEIHSDTSALNKQQTLTRFYKYKCGVNQSPVNAYTEIQDLARILNDMGVPVDDLAVVTKIVSSLPEEKYQAFKAAWDSVDEASQSMSRLLSRLKKLELTTKSSHEDEAELSRAYHSKGQHFKKKGGAHKNEKKGKDMSAVKKETQCFQCGQKGHWKRECKNGQKKSEKDKEASKEKEKEGSKHAERAELGRAFMMRGNWTNSSIREDWISDSGASQHICGDLAWFEEYRNYPVPRSVYLADNSSVKALAEGTVSLSALKGTTWETVWLYNVLYIPGAVNLFSEIVLASKGYTIVRSKDETDFYSTKNLKIPVLKAKSVGNAYVMCFKSLKSTSSAFRVSTKRWHQRLSHVNPQYVLETVKRKAVYGIKESELHDKFSCEDCHMGKATRLPSPPVKKKRETLPGQMVYADLAGKMPVPSLGGAL